VLENLERHDSYRRSIELHLLARPNNDIRRPFEIAGDVLEATRLNQPSVWLIAASKIDNDITSVGVVDPSQRSQKLLSQ
jgi:hypothetical protein